MRNTTPKPYRSVASVDPAKDGVDFINIYSQGKTQLGRDMSHFSQIAFTHPFFGPFACMEGFWFYMKTGKEHDRLRYLYGYRAKTYGRQFDTVFYPEFREDILAANYQRIIQNDFLLDAMIESTLPFTHYYLFAPRVSAGANTDPNAILKPTIVFPKNSDWLIDGFEDIRKALQEDSVPECWSKAEKRYVNNITDAG